MREPRSVCTRLINDSNCGVARLMAASAPQKQLRLYPTEVQVPNDASLSVPVAEVKKLEMADFGSWCNLCVDVFAFSL